MNFPDRDSAGKLPSSADGGYPIIYVFADGADCCPACANNANGSWASDIDDTEAQWRLVGFYIHHEGPTCYCAHCNGAIESAYGDPDAEEEQGCAIKYRE